MMLFREIVGISCSFPDIKHSLAHRREFCSEEKGNRA